MLNDINYGRLFDEEKLSIIMLSAAMAVTMMPASAFATETTEYYAYFVYTNNGVSAYTVGKNDTKGKTLLASTEPIVIAKAEKSALTSESSSSDGAIYGASPEIAAVKTSGNGFVLDGTTVTITSETAGHACHYFFKGRSANLQLRQLTMCSSEPTARDIGPSGQLRL